MAITTDIIITGRNTITIIIITITTLLVIIMAEILHLPDLMTETGIHQTLPEEMSPTGQTMDSIIVIQGEIQNLTETEGRDITMEITTAIITEITATITAIIMEIMEIPIRIAVITEYIITITEATTGITETVEIMAAMPVPVTVI